MSDRITIPAQGRDKDTILNELSKLHLKDIPWKEGRAWSMVYYVDEDHQDLLEQAYSSFFSKNQPDIFVIADQLEQKDWILDRQQLPNSIHLTMMRHNFPVVNQYIADLKAAIDFAQKNPAAVAKGNAALADGQNSFSRNGRNQCSQSINILLNPIPSTTD